MTITAIQAKVSKASADSPVTGTGVDSAAWYNGTDDPQDIYVVVRVRQLTTTDSVIPIAIFTFNTSADGTNYTARAMKEIAGTISGTQQGMEVKWAIPYREMLGGQGAGWGSSADKVRLDCTIPSTNTTCVYEAFAIH